MILSEKFFEQPTVTVAKDLLGKYLVRKTAPTRSRSGQQSSRKISGMIVEVEAYDGFKDKASHASRGLTKRNFPMFGPAGYWYVYFTYGMHWMLNIVTGKSGYPAAVLIRGVESGNRRINGPARVTKYLKIDKRFNNKKAGKKTGLWIEDRDLKIKSLKLKVKSSPRIGIAHAGPVWSKKLYRFYIQ
ncbi:MAG: DNA-3-methyladenine glycosylase [Patescibacteria group bacterium]